MSSLYYMSLSRVGPWIQLLKDSGAQLAVHRTSLSVIMANMSFIRAIHLLSATRHARSGLEGQAQGYRLPQSALLTATASLLIGCALAPLPRASTSWLQRCERSDQALDPWPPIVAIDDFDGDGRAELLSSSPTDAGGMRLGVWDQVDGRFKLIREIAEPEPGGFSLAHAFQFRGQPVVARGWGVIRLFAWPTFDLVAGYEHGSLYTHPLGERLFVLSHRGSRLPQVNVVFDPDTGQTRELALTGRELVTVSAPRASLITLLEGDDGARTLAWLFVDPSEDGTLIETVRTFDWPRDAWVQGAIELDGDPQPELIGIRRRRAAIVDWRDGEWRWSEPILASLPPPLPTTLNPLGVAPLDNQPGVDLLLWSPATLIGGCTREGCTNATELSELGDTNTAVFMDSNLTITWHTERGIAQLRCGS